jgi:hypothetical protein
VDFNNAVGFMETIVIHPGFATDIFVQMADNEHIHIEEAKKALEKGLEHRPSKEDLIDHNILKGIHSKLAG